MPRFFCDDIAGDVGLITGEDALHISRSLRMRPGEAITLCDGKGTDYDGSVAGVDGQKVMVRIAARRPTVSEPALAVTLFQGVPKGDKFEFIVQKAVELGVGAIVPVLMARCVSRPDAAAAKGKIQRWNRVALEAAKQSGRGIIPQVEPPIPMGEALARMKRAALPILLYEKGSASYGGLLAAHPAPGDMALMVGPEGGIAGEEAEMAQCQGIHLATLGPRILRCETAGLCALAVAVQFYEDEGFPKV